MRMILPAAGTGSRLAPITDARPKCLVELAGVPLLERNIQVARQARINDITVVGGYRIDQIRPYDVQLRENPDYATTNMVHTLFLAEADFGDGFIMSYGDIAYAPKVLDALLEAPGDGVSVVVDRAWRAYWEMRSADPLSDTETMTINQYGRILELGGRPETLDEVEGQYIGLVKFGPAGVAAAQSLYAKLCEARSADKHHDPRRMYMTDLIQTLIDDGLPVDAVDIHGGWVEIDSVEDLILAERLVRDGRLA